MQPEKMTAAQARLELLETAKGQKRAAGKNARGQYVGTQWFASRREARRWYALEAMQRAGEISGLRHQCPIELMGRNGPILTPTGKTMTYVADFVYIRDGREVIEDAKGYPSDVYLLKRAILAAQGVEVKEV